MQCSPAGCLGELHMHHTALWAPNWPKTWWNGLICQPCANLGWVKGRRKNSLNFESKFNSSWGSFQPIKRSIFPRGNKFRIFSYFFLFFAQKSWSLSDRHHRHRSIYQTAISSRICNPRPLYQPRNYTTTNIEMKEKIKSVKEWFRPGRNSVSLLRARQCSLYQDMIRMISNASLSRLGVMPWDWRNCPRDTIQLLSEYPSSFCCDSAQIAHEASLLCTVSTDTAKSLGRTVRARFCGSEICCPLNSPMLESWHLGMMLIRSSCHLASRNSVWMTTPHRW